MKRKIILSYAIFFIFVFQSFCQQNQNSENLNDNLMMDVDSARSLYSFLENLEGQKSLFYEEVSATRLLDLLNENYRNDAVAYENKNYISFKNMFNLYIDENRNLLCLCMYIVPKKTLPAEECINIANNWNKRKIFLINCWDEDEESFRLEYYMPYDGGIHSDNLNASIGWFVDLALSFFESLNDYVDGLEQ